MFPEEMTEQEALAEVGLEGRPMQKLDQRRFALDKTQVCAYRLEPGAPAAEAFQPPADPAERSLDRLEQSR